MMISMNKKDIFSCSSLDQDKSIPYLVSFPLIPFSKWNKESSETQLYYSWAKIKIIQYKTQNIIPYKGKKENKKLFDLFLVTL